MEYNEEQTLKESDMKKIHFLLIILFAINLKLASQSCLPEGIEFATQTSIDSFKIYHPGCSEIEGDILIGSWTGNYTITNLDSLIVLKSIGGRLDIIRCESLNSLNGLDSLVTVGSYLTMWHNNSLGNLSGLKSLSSIGEGFAIENNEQLSSIEGLSSLTNVGGALGINGNTILTSLKGLNSLTEIDGFISVMTNVNLIDISGIENIDPYSIQDHLAIRHNYSLSNCAIYSVCDYIAAPNGIIVINDNANGCNSQAEVELACEELSVKNKTIEDSILIFPNPANRFLTVSLGSGNPIGEINIFNLQGQKILSLRHLQNTIDVSKLEKGFYIIEIKSEEIEYNERLIIK